MPRFAAGWRRQRIVAIRILPTEHRDVGLSLASAPAHRVSAVLNRGQAPLGGAKKQFTSYSVG
jgi:hypothetical protein